MTSRELELFSATSDFDHVLEVTTATPWIKAMISAVPIVGSSFDAWASAKVGQQVAERDARFRQWTRETFEYYLQYMRYLAAKVENLEARITEQAEDPQLYRVVGNYTYEAAKEALDERLKMLSAAAAGNVDPTLTIAQKARVERTVRELNPEEVSVLWGLHRTEGVFHFDGTKCGSVGQLRWRLLSEADAEILLAAGCVGTRTMTGYGGGITEAHVTTLGTQVLRILLMYVLERGAPFPIPGRHVKPSDRTNEEAEALLASMPLLTDFLTFAEHSQMLGKQYVMPSSSEGDDVAHLIGNIFDAQALPKSQALIASLDAPLFGEIRPFNESDQSFQVDIRGPHDVLRVAADRIDAGWRV